MNRIILILLAVLLLWGLAAGCSAKTDVQQDDKPGTEEPLLDSEVPEFDNNGGDPVDKGAIPFVTVVTSDIGPKDYEVQDPTGTFNEKQIADFEAIKQKKGYMIFTYAGRVYAYIGLGEKPSSGYNIDVFSVMSKASGVEIKIDEINPTADQEVQDEIKYPYLVIRLDGIGMDGLSTLSFKVFNTQGEDYSNLAE